MADFRIWGKVEQFGPEAFFVIVSAVPDPPVAGTGRFMVDTRVVDLSDQATRTQAAMMRRMVDKLRARGHRVVGAEQMDGDSEGPAT